MKRRLTYILLSILLTFSASASIYDDLPDLGASSDSVMTPAAERRLGKAFMRSVRRSVDVIEDPILVEYIEKLGNKVKPKNQARPFHFFIVNNPSINAFAGPAGYIGINTGLITTTKSEDELAAVLAHEIAHVTQRHLMRAWENNSQLAIPNAALIIAAAVLGAAVDTDAGMAVAAGAQAGLAQQQINFTRSNEREADRVGMEYLTDAGYSASAMPNFFGRMGKASLSYGADIPELLLTHPVTNSRIADSLGRASSYAKTAYEDSIDYEFIKAIVISKEHKDPAEAIARFSASIEDQRTDSPEASRLGLAFAYVSKRDYKQAYKLLLPLAKKYPKHTTITTVLARVEAHTGKGAKAIARLKQGLDINPSSYALNLTLVELMIEINAFEEAQRTLENYAGLTPDQPRLYHLLAQTAGMAGNRLQSHEYQAEYFYGLGQLEKSIFQLELALKLPDISFYDSARIDARLKDIKNEQALMEDKDDL